MARKTELSAKEISVRLDEDWSGLQNGKRSGDYLRASTYAASVLLKSLALRMEYNRRLGGTGSIVALEESE